MGTILLWILLVVIGFQSFLSWRKARAAQKKTEQMSDRLYSWGSETRAMMEELRRQIQRLEFEIKRAAGEIEISPEMRIADILAIHPGIKEVLAGVHLGGCSGCATSQIETLAAGAASYGLDIDQIMNELNRFLANPDLYRGPSEPIPHRIPGESVQIQLPSQAGTH